MSDCNHDHRLVECLLDPDLASNMARRRMSMTDSEYGKACGFGEGHPMTPEQIEAERIWREKP